MTADSDRFDLAIHWPQMSRSRLHEIMDTGRCPSFNVPRKLQVPNGLVALVASSGKVRLVFQISRLEHDVPVTAADGKRYSHGCVLVAKEGTFYIPGASDAQLLPVNRKAPGAFAYLDGKEWVIQTPSIGTPKPPATVVPLLSSYPFMANNIGKTLSKPERELIKAYAHWIGDITMFVHHPLYESGLFTDVFIPRCWTLVEAKASTQRRTLREAFGQLFDYQRHYARHPRLAVLLPEPLTDDFDELLLKKKIIAIWRTHKDTFGDSAGGALTTQLKAVADMRYS